MSVQLNSLVSALDSETRLKMLECLLRGKYGCSALAECVEKDPSTISRHLDKLEKAGLIELKRHGKQVHCTIKNKKKLRQLFKLLKEFEKRS